MGSASRGGRHWLPQEDALLRLALIDCGPGDIATLLGRSEASIIGRASKLGLRYSACVRRWLGRLGERFGQLVLTQVTMSGGRRSGVGLICVCDCGKTVNPDAHNLEKGKSQSCGCSRLTSPLEVGSTYGYWEVIGEALRGPTGERRALCRCRCGKVKPMSQFGLVSGGTKGCRDCMADRTSKFAGYGEIRGWRSRSPRRIPGDCSSTRRGGVHSQACRSPSSTLNP
jgi:hypothetical protein